MRISYDTIEKRNYNHDYHIGCYNTISYVNNLISQGIETLSKNIIN